MGDNRVVVQNGKMRRVSEITDPETIAFAEKQFHRACNEHRNDPEKLRMLVSQCCQKLVEVSMTPWRDEPSE